MNLLCLLFSHNWEWYPTPVNAKYGGEAYWCCSTCGKRVVA